MPYRKTPLVKGEVYHIYNRSVAHQPIFPTTKYYERAYEVLSYYSNLNPPVRYSHFARFSSQLKTDILEKLNKENKKLVEILAFCLMPNHIHFLIREINDNGITTFMRKFQNSYAKYFNIKDKRDGSLFQSMFKAVRILTNEQLLHVMRYIHLNPLTSYILKDIEQLNNYPWTSYSIYMGNHPSSLIKTEEILGFFESRNKFAEFTKNQVNYQRELNKIKHLLLE